MNTTDHSNALIRSSWHAVQRQTETFSATFYDTLFNLDPALRPMFHTDLAPQRQRLVAMIGAAVDLLDQPDSLMPALRDLGRRHGGYGVREAHYATVGAALLVALRATQGTAFTPAVRTAWTDLFGLISAVMMEAARPPVTRAVGRIPAMAATMVMALAAGSVLAAEPGPFGSHPALASRNATAAATATFAYAIDPNTFILGHPASPTTRGGHANFEHPAIQVARLARHKTIDPNTLIVQPPASVTWRVEPEAEGGNRLAQAASPDRSGAY